MVLAELRASDFLMVAEISPLCTREGGWKGEQGREVLSTIFEAKGGGIVGEREEGQR